MATVRSRRRGRRSSGPVHHNVAVPMSDGVVLRADIHYPTVPENGRPATGPFPVLLSMTP